MIILKSDSEIVQNANSKLRFQLEEVGFIPGDKYGCKIYAEHDYFGLRLIGSHNSVYGCRKLPNEQVEIVD